MFGLTFELLDPKECRAPREGWGFVVGDLMDVSHPHLDDLQPLESQKHYLI